jgi:hypothetical protein
VGDSFLGHFLNEDIMIPDRTLGDTVSSLEGEEREAFLDLAKGMLVWHPDARKTAGELAGEASFSSTKANKRLISASAFARGMTQNRG